MQHDGDDGAGQTDDDADQAGDRRVACVDLAVALTLGQGVEPVRDIPPGFGDVSPQLRDRVMQLAPRDVVGAKSARDR